MLSESLCVRHARHPSMGTLQADVAQESEELAAAFARLDVLVRVIPNNLRGPAWREGHARLGRRCPARRGHGLPRQQLSRIEAQSRGSDMSR